jgi:hypothetical protein
MMQVEKTELFDDVDFHSNNLLTAVFSATARFGVMTDYEILEEIATIVAKRRQPDAGLLDVGTGLRY